MHAARIFEVMDWRNRITTDPVICHGKSCIAGTRIMASVVLVNLAAGASPEDIFVPYPSPQRADVTAVIGYAAELARERADQRRVKFKLEENLSLSLSRLFVDAGHDAHSVLE
jgi:uncharacterized protein (DUF433 family)